MSCQNISNNSPSNMGYINLDDYVSMFIFMNIKDIPFHINSAGTNSHMIFVQYLGKLCIKPLTLW